MSAVLKLSFPVAYADLSRCLCILAIQVAESDIVYNTPTARYGLEWQHKEISYPTLMVMLKVSNSYYTAVFIKPVCTNW